MSKPESKSFYRFIDYNHSNTLVLLHGFLGSSEIWSNLIEELQIHFNLLLIDLPGHGENKGIHQNQTILDMAIMVQKVADSHDISSYHLLGHSMGGYVGLEILANYPDKLKSLILLNSTARADSPEKREDRDRAAQVFDHNPKAFVNQAILNLFYAPNIPSLGNEVIRLQDIAQKTTIEGAKAALMAMKRRSDHSAIVNSTLVPIMYIAGVHDSTVLYETILDQITSKNIKLVSMEYSGHMSFAEEAKLCTESIIKFITSL